MHDDPEQPTTLASAAPTAAALPDEDGDAQALTPPTGRDTLRSIEYWYFCETESPHGR